MYSNNCINYATKIQILVRLLPCASEVLTLCEVIVEVTILNNIVV
jgi:hypothetical protein